MPPALLAPVVMLAAVFCAGALVLHKEARRRRLAQQLALATRGLERTVEARRSIRRRDGSEDRWRTIAYTLLRYDPEASLAWPPSRTIIAGTALAVLLFLVEQMAAPLWLTIAAAPVTAALAIRSLFTWQRERYADRLLRQLPDAIQVVVGAVRAGLPVTEAFGILSREMHEPTEGEFRRAVAELALGRRPDEVLLNIYRRTGIPEFAMFSVTLSVQAKAGGRLAETLAVMGDTIRERVAIAGRAKALAGEAKLSAQIVGVLPFLAAAGLSVIHPAQLAPFVTDPRGRLMLAYAVGSWLAGVLMMRWLIKKGTAV